MRIILSNGGLMVFFSMVQKDAKKSPTKKKTRFFRWCFSDGVTFFWGKNPKSKEDELRLKLSEPGKEARPQEMPEKRSFIFYLVP